MTIHAHKNKPAMRYGFLRLGALLFVLCMLMSGIVRATELVFTAAPYPYTTGFENTNNEWAVASGAWGISADHADWNSHQGIKKLDNNPAGADQVSVSGHAATLLHTIIIPWDSAQPHLTYWYKLNVNYMDNMLVQLQVEGSADWLTLRKYTEDHNHNAYTREFIPLEIYKGQAIRIRFVQNNAWVSGPRLFVVDDLSIADLQLNTLPYPYTQDFEYFSIGTDWNMQGSWYASMPHGTWMNHGGSYHLDNNVQETSLYAYKNGQAAEMTDYIAVPTYALLPTLSYWYQLRLTHYQDLMYVEVQEKGSNVWSVLKEYKERHNHTGYTRENISLGSYLGKEIRFRFRQNTASIDGVRVFLIDDVEVADFQAASYAFPYESNFDTQTAQDQWNLQGTWSMAGNHGNWVSSSPAFHLDSNATEYDLESFYEGQLATQNGFVLIPASSGEPVITFNSRMFLARYDDSVYLEIQEQGSSIWTVLKSYNDFDNSDVYVHQELNIAQYKGKPIRLRFRQFNSWNYGVRIWAIDDVKIFDKAGVQDTDSDGVPNAQDQCPGTAPNTAVDINGCPLTAIDTDGDGVADINDTFPNDATEWADMDADGVGDNRDPDRDGDGISNADEVQLGTDPNNNTSTPPDADGDHIPDALDADRDGDGVPNASDVFPDNAGESTDLDHDGTGDNADTDRDGDGVENTVDVFPNDPSETSDLDQDGIGDNADTDRDGDGVLNDQDTYPGDPARNKLAAVQALVSQQQGTHAVLNWQAHAEANISAYNVYRATYNQSNWQLLNSVAATATSYLDTTVANGQTYQYQVAAVDNATIEGTQSSPANQFIIFNNTVLNTAQGEWLNYQARVSWTHTLVANESYRLYKMNGATRTLIYTGNNASYTDTTAQWNAAQPYQLVSVMTFTHLITAQPQSVESAALALELAALPALQLTLDDAVLTAPNQYQIEIIPNTQLMITGHYTAAVNAIQAQLTYGQNTVSAAGSNGQFQLVVRAAPLGAMTLTLTETGAPANRNVSVTINLMSDQSPLQMVLDSTIGLSTTLDHIEISGVMQNVSQSITAISASNARYGTQTFALLMQDQTRFAGELPLQTGANNLTVQATDRSGQTASANISITRQASLLPSVMFTSHSNNQVLNSDKINVQGRIYTTQDISKIQLSVNGQAAILSHLQAQEYLFSIPNFTLVNGYNRLVARAETPAGHVESALILYYQDASTTASTALDLFVATPHANQAVNTDLLVVQGTLTHALTNPNVTVNGTTVSLYGNHQTGYAFSHALNVSAVTADFTVTVAASASGQTSTQKVITVNLDRTAPVITLDNVLQATPAVNDIRELPYHLTGSVSDERIGNVSINGQSLTLQPAPGVNTYRFDTYLQLTAAQQTNLVIEASDLAGNSSSLRYVLNANPQAALDIIQPLEHTVYTTLGNSHAIEFITRITNLTEAASLHVTAGTRSQTLPINQELVNGSISIDTLETHDKLRFEVRNAANDVLTARDIPFSITRLDNLPLTLEKTVPAANTEGREPHHPIQLYFNRPVALANLRVVVKHTVHGPSYSTDYIPGAVLQNKYQGEVVDINRDQAVVAGALSLVPGERIVEFYPATDLPYGSDVFVEVYERVTLGADRELARFIYRVRPNPTFIITQVSDQNGVMLRDIVVSLPERDLTARTDQYGNVGFGQGLSAEQALTAGSYRILVNAKGQNPHYGRGEFKFNLEAGKVNRPGRLVVPALDTTLAYRYLQSGTEQNVLAAGDLVIDTRNAVLTFPNNGTAGSVQAVLVDTSSGMYRVSHINLTPLWMFNLQPGPVRVRGAIAVQLTLPQFNNSYSYLPANGSRVLLMGQSADTLEIVPIGVGLLNNHVATSEGPVRAERLDYLGVALVAPEHQAALQRYAEGAMSLDQLMGQLTQD